MRNTRTTIPVIYADAWKVHGQVQGWRKGILIWTSGSVVGPQEIKDCHDLYCIRPIGDVNDSVFPLPLFPAIYSMGPFLIT
jgi:hypothetical protein